MKLAWCIFISYSLFACVDANAYTGGDNNADTFILVSKGYSNADLLYAKEDEIVGVQHQVRLRAEVGERFCYLTLYVKSNSKRILIFEDFLAYSGVEYTVAWLDGSVSFMEEGNTVLKCQYVIHKMVSCIQDLRDRLLWDSVHFYSSFTAFTATHDSVLNVQLAMLGSFKSNMPPEAFEYLACNIRRSVLLSKVKYFYSLLQPYSLISAIFGSQKAIEACRYEVYRLFIDKLLPVIKKESEANGIHGLYMAQAFYWCVRVNTEYSSRVSLFSSLKQLPAGICRDKALVFYVQDHCYRDSCIDEKMAEALLIMQDGFARRELEKMRARLANGAQAYLFALLNSCGGYSYTSDFKGRVMVLDFWFTGCASCVQLYNDVLRPVETLLEQDSGVVFVSVCVDKEKEEWLQSISEEIYTREGRNVCNVFTNGEGEEHAFIKAYLVTGYPTILLFNVDGKLSVKFQKSLKSKTALLRSIEYAKTIGERE